MLYVKKDECKGCGICVSSAPEGAIVMENGIAKMTGKNCKNEKECIESCPFGAIKKK